MSHRYFNISTLNSTSNFARGSYNIEFPTEFYLANCPKHIRVINFTYLNSTGQIDIGTSLHSDFNTVSPELENLVCYSSFGNANEKTFQISDSKRSMEFWFKDYTGSTVFPITTTEYFIIQLELIY